MTTTVRQPAWQETPGRWRSWPGLGALVLGLAILGVAFVGCGASPYVAEITVVNPTGYPLGVEVAGEGDSAWLLLGTAQPGREHRFEEVFDQGDTWVFRFSYAGRVAGELTVPRSELESAGWRIEVPPAVGTALLDEGVPPPPSP